MKKRAWLIFNPASGRKSGADLEEITRLVAEHADVEVFTTSPEEDAGMLARRARDAGVEWVLAAGGDGTVSAVADQLLGSETALGIIPRGTANSMCASLGLPQTVEAACAALGSAVVRRVDAARVNGRAMVLLAGIGFHADTIERTSRESKSKLGALAYLFSGLAQLADFSSFDVELETDEKIIRTKAIAVTVANMAPPTTVLAQGPAQIVPDDGLLDVTIVAAQEAMEAFATATHLLWTATQELPASRSNVGFLRCTRARISASPEQKVMVDGEIVDVTPITVECLPRSLAVLAPPLQLPHEDPAEKLDGLPNLEVIEKHA